MCATQWILGHPESQNKTLCKKFKQVNKNRQESILQSLYSLYIVLTRPQSIVSLKLDFYHGDVKSFVGPLWCRACQKLIMPVETYIALEQMPLLRSWNSSQQWFEKEKKKWKPGSSSLIGFLSVWCFLLSAHACITVIGIPLTTKHSSLPHRFQWCPWTFTMVSLRHFLYI